jgi:Mrp family chromosome partitioning ATPase
MKTRKMEEGRALAKHVIIVMSGKGGVGKSSVAVSLALALQAKGKQVGLLDVDLCGPSVARMLGVEGRDIQQSARGWVPVKAAGLVVMSMAFLSLDRNAAVVWRGPKKSSVIGQFLNDVDWGDLDYLVVDTPPGTSDEHITVTQELKRFPLDGAVLVTTPQNISLGDVRREIAFCRKGELPILGIFENMSGFVCPHCSECTRVFSSGGGAALAQAQNIPFLGTLPIDPRVGEILDRGTGLEELFRSSGDGGKSSLQAIVDFVDAKVAADEKEK